MKFIIALASLAIGTILVGFITVAIIEGVQSWGVQETFLELSHWPNILITAGCIVFGLAFLTAGAVALAMRTTGDWQGIVRR